MEEFNLTIKNLESRNRAIESQCKQLEHQNLQIADDRKKIDERLQAIENVYQKTLQEKIQLEKDLYDANHQLLSYKVMA